MKKLFHGSESKDKHASDGATSEKTPEKEKGGLLSGLPFVSRKDKTSSEGPPISAAVAAAQAEAQKEADDLETIKKVIRKIDRRERRNPISHPTEFPVEPGSESAMFVRNSLRQLDAHQTLLIGMTIAYFVAHFGWTHWAWMVLTLGYVLMREVRKQNKERNKLRRKIEINHQAALITTSAEGSLWVNDFVRRMLPQIKKTLTDSTMQSIKSSIENYMHTSKPAGLESIEVTDIEFGEATPRLLDTVTFNLRTDFQTEFDLNYDSNFRMNILVKVGGKFMALPVPILVKNVKLYGRMRLIIHFCDTMPFLEVVTVAFKSPPVIDLDIKPLKGVLDIMDIGSLQYLLQQTIQNVLIKLMVLPNRLTIPLQGKAKSAPPTPKTEPEEERKAKGGFMDMSFLSKSKDTNPKAPKPNGTIHIKVHNAENLTSADSNGKSDPYVLILVGDSKAKTKPKKKTLDPVWEEDFSLKAYLTDGAKLDIEIFDWNQFESHSSLGIVLLDLTPYLTPENLHKPHKLALPLTLRDMKAKDVNRGTLHLEINIAPDPFADFGKKKDESSQPASLRQSGQNNLNKSGQQQLAVPVTPVLNVNGEVHEDSATDKQFGATKSRSFKGMLGFKKKEKE